MKIEIKIDYYTKPDKYKINRDILTIKFQGKTLELDTASDSIQEIENLNNFILENIIEHNFEIIIPQEVDTTPWKIAHSIKKICESEINAIKKDLENFDVNNLNIENS